MIPLLTATGLAFGYSPQVPIFDDFSDEFYPGEIVALTGASGSGKSTLLYMLGLMLQPDSGHLIVNNQDTTGLRDQELAHLRATLFGFVFQDSALDSTRSVLDNITETALYRNQPLPLARSTAHHLMEQLGVDLRADHKPGEISGGQAQRVALCRALLGNPRILLTDEPTGNLDRNSADTVWKAMRTVADSGGTVIVATHDRDVVSACTRTIAL